jgi:hypothetical protein
MISDTFMDLLHKYIDAPEDPETNFSMGLYYHSIDQTASAVSFYLRTAERSTDQVLVYECLLRAAMCFNTQGCRSNSVEGMLQHAVAILPRRPEAYFHLSRFYEKKEMWQLGYTMACIGMGVAEKTPGRPLRTKIDYPGFWTLAFEKAVCGWWCGLCEESKNTFDYLLFNEPLDYIHKLAVINNLKKLDGWVEEKDIPTYMRSKEEEINQSIYELEIYLSKNKSKLRHKFNSYEGINRSYSEAWQDMFVLTLFDGMREGKYIEIGSGYPIYANNTYLLEREFGWRGISIDNQRKFTQKHILHRSHTALYADATTCDYIDLSQRCGFGDFFEYLSVDCGDPIVSLSALEKVITSGIRFGAVTFCHENHKHPESGVRMSARDVMRKNGYRLLVSNVSYGDSDEYEDWFVDGKRFNHQVLESLRDDNDNVTNITKIFL